MSSSWRDVITVHPAAELFPLLGEAELRELGNDINAHGLTSPIAIMIENGKPLLLDGRNRLDAMEKVGLRVELLQMSNWRLVAKENLTGQWQEIEISRRIVHGVAVMVITADPVEYIASANIHRRHLMAETKRELVAKLLQEHPERSDRATAALVKVDGKTVASVRREMEDVRSIPHVSKRVDTKGREQPASKPKVEPEKTVSTMEVAEKLAPVVKELTAEGKKNMATMSPATVMHLAGTLRNQLDEWAAPEGFKQATHLIGAVKRFAEFCEQNTPELVAHGVMPSERYEVIDQVTLIRQWLSGLMSPLAQLAADKAKAEALN